MTSARQITVLGHVQGVGFRYDCRRQAHLFGLAGWVRNVSDGSVVIHAEGSEEALEALIAWCHDGPPGAHVREVQVNPAAVSMPEGVFEIQF